MEPIPAPCAGIYAAFTKWCGVCSLAYWAYWAFGGQYHAGYRHMKMRIGFHSQKIQWFSLVLLRCLGGWLVTATQEWLVPVGLIVDYSLSLYLHHGSYAPSGEPRKQEFKCVRNKKRRESWWIPLVSDTKWLQHTAKTDGLYKSVIYFYLMGSWSNGRNFRRFLVLNHLEPWLEASHFLGLMSPTGNHEMTCDGH